MHANVLLSSLLLLLSIPHGFSMIYRHGLGKNRRLVTYRSETKKPVMLDNVKTGFFTQKLDHFNEKDTQTFNQLYWVNEKYHKNGGPAFLSIEGEGPSDEFNIDSAGEMHWLKNAKKHGAILFQLEHRYYGRSIPLQNMSTDNLRFLSSRQAIEDIVSYIKAMNSLYNLDNAKWIVFGGSYSGSLAAWVQQMHPEIVAGAISSSGPIQAMVNFKDYLKVTNESFSNHNSECGKEIHKAFLAADQLILTEEGKQQIKEKFNLCSPIDAKPTANDLGELFLALQDTFVTVAQYGGDNKGVYADFLTLQSTCKVMLDKEKPVIDRLAILSNRSLTINNQTCLEFRYSESIKAMQEIDPYKGENLAGRLWLYQCCTEFAWFQTTDSQFQPFGNHTPVSFFTQQCPDVFGQKISVPSIYKAVQATNKHYGAKNGYTGKNVVLVNGSQDPWHPAGIYAQDQLASDSSARVVLMKGEPHCADMYPPNKFDSEDVKYARTVIEEHLDKWLN